MSNKVGSIPELDTPMVSNEPSKLEENDPSDPFNQEISCTRDLNNKTKENFSTRKILFWDW